MAENMEKELKCEIRKEGCEYVAEYDTCYQDCAICKKQMCEYCLNEHFEECIKPIGEIHITEIEYWKYMFTIHILVDTANGGSQTFEIKCGGDPDDIYKFDPNGGPEEWVGAVIRSVREI